MKNVRIIIVVVAVLLLAWQAVSYSMNMKNYQGDISRVDTNRSGNGIIYKSDPAMEISQAKASYNASTQKTAVFSLIVIGATLIGLIVLKDPKKEES